MDRIHSLVLFILMASSSIQNSTSGIEELWPWENTNITNTNITGANSTNTTSAEEEDGECELGTIECVDGKWKLDTRLMALAMTCPLPLDGNPDSVMKLAKCAMNKLGIYDGENLSDDYVETACSMFSQKKLRNECLVKAQECSDLVFFKYTWELSWPGFGICFLPWVMGICNI